MALAGNGRLWRWIPLSILFLLLTFRLGVYLHAEVSVVGDGAGYLARAKELVSTGRLPALTLQPNGYSILLAPFLQTDLQRTAILVGRWQQLLDLGIVLALIGYAVLVMGWRHKIVLFAMSAFLLLQPFTGTMSAMIYTEQMVMFGSFIGFLLLVFGMGHPPSRIRFTCILGGALLVGVASVLRSDIFALNAVAMVLLACWNCLLSRTRWKVAVVAVAMSLMIPLMVCSLQFLSSGQFGFTIQNYHFEGYAGWLRTLRLDRNEYVHLAWGIDTSPGRGKPIEVVPSRVFASPQERQHVAELLDRWNRFGFANGIDSEFERLAVKRTAADPFGIYIANPLYRMQHFWLNRDGGQFYIVPLSLKPPLSSVVAMFTLVGRFLIFLFFIIGTFAMIGTARRLFRRLPDLPGFQDEFALFSVAYAILRTLELGIVGIFKYAAVMEIRYISVAVPFALVVCIRGVEALTARQAKIGKHLS
jgi:hypothetical protein